MANICLECGASLNPNESCQSNFEAFLTQEYSQSKYGEVHFLTVTCFMIQHGRYGDAALRWIEPRLRAFLKSGTLSNNDRLEMARAAGNNHRHWKVSRQLGEKELPKISWTFTIADVARQYNDADTYCALVKEWASTTLAEMQQWLTSG